MPAAALGNALDTMMTHPLALQPRSAIGELGNFLACETAAAQGITPRPAAAKPPVLSAADVATKLEPPKRCCARPGAHRRESLPYVGARRAAGVAHPAHCRLHPEAWETASPPRRFRRF